MSEAVKDLILVMDEGDLLNQIAFCHKVQGSDEGLHIKDRAKLEKNVLLDYATGLCRQGVLAKGFYVCRQGIDSCLVISISDSVSLVHNGTEITATKVAP